MAENLDMTCNDLRKNVLFNLSLSSNELFHSNLIAYIAEFFSDDFKGQDSDDFKGKDEIDVNGSFCEVEDLQSCLHRRVFSKVMDALGLKPPSTFPIDSGTPEKPCKYVYVVKREKNNFDLAFWQWPVCYSQVSTGQGRNSNPKPKLLGVTELKIKSLPDPDQLKRYTQRLDAPSKGKPPATKDVARSIVSMVSGKQPIPCPWSRKTLRDLSDGLKAVVSDCCSAPLAMGDDVQRCDDLSKLIGQYTELLDLLDKLGTQLDITIDRSLTLDSLLTKANGLKPCRMNATLHKLAYDWIRLEVVGELKKRLAVQGYKEVVGKDPDCIAFRDSTTNSDSLTFRHHAGMTRSTGLCGFGWVVSSEASDKMSGKVSVGVQVQDHDFKCFVNAVDGALTRTRIFGNNHKVVPTIETELLWGHVVPQGTCRGGEKSYQPSHYHGCSSIEDLNKKLSSGNGTSVEFVASACWYNALIATSSKLYAAAIPKPSNFVRPLFHGYNPVFCDARFSMNNNATLDLIALAMADYMEWLVFGTTTAPFAVSSVADTSDVTGVDGRTADGSPLDTTLPSLSTPLSKWYKDFRKKVTDMNRQT